MVKRYDRIEKQQKMLNININKIIKTIFLLLTIFSLFTSLSFSQPNKNENSKTNIGPRVNSIIDQLKRELYERDVAEIDSLIADYNKNKSQGIEAANKDKNSKPNLSDFDDSFEGLEEYDRQLEEYYQDKWENANRRINSIFEASNLEAMEPATYLESLKSGLARTYPEAEGGSFWKDLVNQNKKSVDIISNILFGAFMTIIYLLAFILAIGLFYYFLILFCMLLVGLANILDIEVNMEKANMDKFIKVSAFLLLILILIGLSKLPFNILEDIPYLIALLLIVVWLIVVLVRPSRKQ